MHAALIRLRQTRKGTNKERNNEKAKTREII
jgi:hypothetical protein